MREGCLGRGAYGTVYKERCADDAQPRVRAVKEINKNVVAGEEIDHTRELEAIAKFSHPRVCVPILHHGSLLTLAPSVLVL